MPGDPPLTDGSNGKREPSPPSLAQLAAFFLQLGTFTFGGPAAHLAVMEDQLVRRRGWLTREQFLDLLGAANLIPGPTSTELAVYIGYRVAGVRGLLLAGSCFILPAATMVTAIAWAYVKFGRLPAVNGILYGVQPVVIAIIIQALWRLGRAAVKTPFLALIGATATALSLWGINPIAVIFGAGVLVAMTTATARRFKHPEKSPILPPAIQLPLAAGAAATTAAATVGLWPLFLVFLKIGSVVFGSGYVLLAFLRDDLVTGRHWITESQLFVSIAVGQVTPGPVFTTATFIGYLLMGPSGAAVATAGIFLPAFALVWLTAPIVRRIRQWPAAGAFMDGLNVASTGLIAAVAWQLGVKALVDAKTIIIGAASAIILLLWRVNPTWLILAAAALGIWLGRAV